VILAAICAATVLSACSAFKEHTDYYKSVQEGRPLEVPPDLDSPPNANELVVPAAGTAGAAHTAAASGSTTPGSAAPASTAPPPGAMVAVGGNELHRAENVQDTWEKVGSALQRSELGKLSHRDEPGHTFTFDFDAPMEKPSEGFMDSFKHVLGFGEGQQVKQQLTVFVTDDNGGSRIVVTGPGNTPPAVYAQQRTAKELAKYVPGASITNAASATTPVNAEPPASTVPPPSAAAPAPAAAPPAAVSSVPPAISGVSVAGADLHVADTVQNTWQRVGLALERAQVGSVSARDEAAHTYTLNFSGTVETKPDGETHWYSKVLHPFGGDSKTEQIQRQLTVRVADDSGGAKVSVEGDTSDKSTADAARRVVEVLRERLS
jgi:uncharacterized lipoprotein